MIDKNAQKQANEVIIIIIIILYYVKRQHKS